MGSSLSLSLVVLPLTSNRSFTWNLGTTGLQGNFVSGLPLHLIMVLLHALKSTFLKWKSFLKYFLNYTVVPASLYSSSPGLDPSTEGTQEPGFNQAP